MKKWEYKVVEMGTCLAPGIKSEGLSPYTERELERYGEERWEVVAVIARNPGFVIFLKREKKKKK